MDELERFEGFFSYAHEDAKAHPKLIEGLTRRLEQLVNLNFTHDRFVIWRDRESLRLADKWRPKIDAALRSSDILIIWLTPRWIGSEQCRREYETFVRTRRAKDDQYCCVAPIVVEEIDRQRNHFTNEEDAIYNEVTQHQYVSMLATNFLSLPKTARDKLLQEIADAIVGMIQRRSDISGRRRASAKPGNKRPTAEKKANANPETYGRIDFLTEIKVLLDPSTPSEWKIFAQADFVKSLCVRSRRGEIEFGVRRAYLKIWNEGPGQLAKVPELRGDANNHYVYYRTLQEAADAITMCIDPRPGESSLGEMALPPTLPENYLSKVATATDAVKSHQLKAEMIISLDSEGLYLAEGWKRTPTRHTLNQIQAIMNAVIAKFALSSDQIVEEGQYRRKVPVRDRIFDRE